MIRWKLIKKEDQRLLQEFFCLYDSMFPIDVREPHEVFLRSFDLDSFLFLVGLEDGKIISFLTAHYLADVNSGFIVYLGTVPTQRNKGLGKRTLNKIEEMLNEESRSNGYSSFRALVLETERQEAVHSDEEKADCVRRNRFFSENGFKAEEMLHYVQPPLHKGQSPIPLEFFLKSKERITLDECKEIIKSLYREKYLLANEINSTILSDCMKDMGVIND
ncbi:GNAT family N-acetyltransferase [Bacillus weihaiensis]|uniref:N-acetyltransferase domain-containing protein n=1 Tax=Bacillus weihaiensis TaxID=1547283 RepID=A0A1L3MTJ4_9BACI|nr:GNAT family N-acetyltransferase [Bacillus weihaiensis]APH05657.1 hypothetical protein A9C19_13355 [Bacillus weihaiensis]